GVAMGVVLAHDVARDAGALGMGPIGPVPHVEHPPEDAPVHGLETVAHVGQGPLHDDRHRVVEERALHLLLKLDGLDADGARAVARGACVTHMSRNLTSLACVWMK